MTIKEVDEILEKFYQGYSVQFEGKFYSNNVEERFDLYYKLGSFILMNYSLTLLIPVKEIKLIDNVEKEKFNLKKGDLCLCLDRTNRKWFGTRFIELREDNDFQVNIFLTEMGFSRKIAKMDMKYIGTDDLTIKHWDSCRI